MSDEHQNFIPIFVCIHGNLSKCLQTEDRTGCGRIGAVIFKSLYKNKRENVWVPGVGGGNYGVSRGFRD